MKENDGKKVYHANSNPKKAGWLYKYHTTKQTLKQKIKVTRDKKGHFIMMKGQSIRQVQQLKTHMHLITEYQNI